MNILFLSTENPYPPDGGHHLRTFNVLKILAQQHKIYFIAFAQDKNELRYIPNIKEYCETVDVYLVPQTGLGLKFLMLAAKNLFCRYPLVVQRYIRKEAQERIKQILANHSIDLAHIDMLALGSYKKNLSKVPTILTNHNVESLRLYRWIKLEKKLLIKSFLFYQYLKLRRFEQRMCTQFDCCVVVSQFDRQYLQKLCQKNNFSIIPNGVDTEYFEPINRKPLNNHLVWVGGMASAYNSDAVDFFLDKIWPQIENAIPEITMDFIGNAPTQKLQQKAIKNPKIKTLGFVDDIRPFIALAAAFVAPIRSGSGTKIKVLNAMAQAKPVVATTIAAEGIEVTEGENILIADQPDEFAQKVIYLLKNPGIAQEIGQRARRLIEEKYSWHVIAKEMRAIYENQTCSKQNAI